MTAYRAGRKSALRTPLKHERETLLDTYFSDFITEEID
jgi:hypothetical protein